MQQVYGMKVIVHNRGGLTGKLAVFFSKPATHSVMDG